MLLQTCQIEGRQPACSLLAAGANVIRLRDQPGPEQVAVWAERAFLGELRCVRAHRRNSSGMRILDVDVERPRAGIFEGADRLISWRDAVDGQALQAVGIRFQVGVAEYADSAGIGLELLDDQIV